MMRVDLYDAAQRAVTDGASLCDVLESLNNGTGVNNVWPNGWSFSFVDLTGGDTPNATPTATTPTDGARRTRSRVNV